MWARAAGSPETPVCWVNGTNLAIFWIISTRVCQRHRWHIVRSAKKCHHCILDYMYSAHSMSPRTYRELHIHGYRTPVFQESFSADSWDSNLKQVDYNKSIFEWHHFAYLAIHHLCSGLLRISLRSNQSPSTQKKSWHFLHVLCTVQCKRTSR